MNNLSRNPNQHMSATGNSLGIEVPKNRKGQCLAWISQIDRRWFMGGNYGGSERGLDQMDGDPAESDLPGIDESLAV